MKPFADNVAKGLAIHEKDEEASEERKKNLRILKDKTNTIEHKLRGKEVVGLEAIKGEKWITFEQAVGLIK
jgi:hypothetical protein